MNKMKYTTQKYIFIYSYIYLCIYTYGAATVPFSYSLLLLYYIFPIVVEFNSINYKSFKVSLATDFDKLRSLRKVLLTTSLSLFPTRIKPPKYKKYN